MKRIFSLALAVFLLAVCTAPAFAANAQSGPEVNISIISPSSIKAQPVCSADIEVRVTNQTDHKLSNLICFLMIVDVGRQQTYPVDEFGENAYQTRNITLAPGETTIVTIPVKITYVGLFKFSASVMNLDTGMTVTALPLSVHMVAVSNLNKTLVTVTAAIVPVLLIGMAAILFRRRNRHRKNKQ